MKWQVLLGSLFKEALQCFVRLEYQDPRKANALETLVVLLRSILQKDLAGWEIMDVLAGNVSESDQVFGVSGVIYPVAIPLSSKCVRWKQLVENIETVLESPDAPGTFPFFP